MAIHDLYGSQINDIESVRNAVEMALRISMRAHENSSRGLYYLFVSPEQERYTLQKNIDLTDIELGEVGVQESEFVDYPVIFFVENLQLPERSEKLKGLLATVSGLAYLRHHENLPRLL